MSIIPIVLNLTLGALLIAALGLGWRLERRLKGLRDSHESFAKAVDDLDRAATRAEQGLADLRAATDEAAETLAVRIERAKSLAARLENAVERAPAPAPAPAPAQPQLRPRELRSDLILEDAAPRLALRPSLGREDRPAIRNPALQPAAQPQVRPPLASRLIDPRSRARLDDDLFDEGARHERVALRAAAGGRR
jgi:hypothetical protein